MEQLTGKEKKDLKVLATFVATYCAAKHREQHEYPLPAELYGNGAVLMLLCPECTRLLDYAVEKRRGCPLVPKPSCKHCHIHCYSQEYRATVREVMAYSGRKLILKGRLDYLWHYFF